MSGTTEHPKVFISYSWTSSEHEEKVLELATALRKNGVDAILDKWDLKPGQDKYVFMEAMVTDASIQKVLMFCDRRYQERADQRAGGVGTESQIISAEIYGKVREEKFIPLICEYDEEGEPCLPVFLKSRLFIDISDDVKYGDGLEELLRRIYDQPFHEKPKLGSAPEFLKPTGNLVQVRELSALLRAIHDGRVNKQGLEQIFTRGVLSEINSLYGQPVGDEYYEAVYKEIVATKGLRDQLELYFDAVATFSDDAPASLAPSLRLFDSLGAKFGPPLQNGTFYPGWADLYRFFALEAMLLLTAALIRYERWTLLRKLLGHGFTVATENRGLKVMTHAAFNSGIVSIDEHRNRRMQLNRVSASADMLKERCSEDGITFAELQQADLFLALRSAVTFNGEEPGYQHIWQARTSIFSQHDRPILFERAANADTRDGILLALDVPSGEEMRRRVDASSAAFNGLRVFMQNRSGFIDFAAQTNLEALMK